MHESHIEDSIGDSRQIEEYVEDSTADPTGDDSHMEGSIADSSQTEDYVEDPTADPTEESSEREVLPSKRILPPRRARDEAREKIHLNFQVKVSSQKGEM